MRVIDATLAAYMLTGDGDAIVRASINGVTHNLISYKWDNLSFRCVVNGTATATAQQLIVPTRGLLVGVTEYLVEIGTFFIESVQTDQFGNTNISAHALPNGAATNIDGDDDALTVLNRVGAVYGCTFKGIAAVNDWLDTWALFKTDSLLNLTSSKQIESLMRTARRAFLFQRYDGIYITNPAVDRASYASVYALTLPEFYEAIQTTIKSYILFWKDENNFNYSNYEGGGVAPASAPRQNIGFVHSSVVANEVGALGGDGGGEWRFKQVPPNLAFEQGDPVSVGGVTTIIKFVETFNYPSNSGWKQVITDQHWQPFGVADPIIIQEGDDYITQLITNIVNQTIQQITNNYIEANTAAEISVNPSTFNTLLDSGDTLLQGIVEKLDDHFHDEISWLLYERFY